MAPDTQLLEALGQQRQGGVGGHVERRFATHYGFRPDWCEAEDPQSKGIVEHLAGYAQTDLLVPSVDDWGDDLAAANAAARGWCDEVNSVVHFEIAAIPAVRLVTEREVLRPLPSLRPALRRGVQRKVDRMATVRFGSARYSVPAGLVGQSVQVVAEESRILVLAGETTVAVHPLIAPGEVSIIDDHYGGPRRAPARAVRARSGTERSFLQLGPVAEDFLRAAAAAGVNKLPSELAGIVDLIGPYGTDAVVAALGRGLTFRRFTAADIRSILDAGTRRRRRRGRRRTGRPRPTRRAPAADDRPQPTGLLLPGPPRQQVLEQDCLRRLWRARPHQLQPCRTRRRSAQTATSLLASDASTWHPTQLNWTTHPCTFCNANVGGGP